MRAVNLGTGTGYSVLDVLHAYEAACGKPLPYRIEARRSGDVAACYADPTLARTLLGWSARYDLARMCADSWRWQSQTRTGTTTEPSPSRVHPSPGRNRGPLLWQAAHGAAVSTQPLRRNNVMQHPVLVVMAAGMGSRYGGLKQIDPIGPHGEIIIDYSLFDAMRAGFEKVVFIISRRIEADFKEVVGDRVAEHLQVEYVFQELDAHLPAGFAIPAGRQKPWGNRPRHSLLAANTSTGRSPSSMRTTTTAAMPSSCSTTALCRSCDRDGKYDFSMVGFRLANTLTEHGSVARGICETDATGRLINIVERTRVALQDGSPAFTEDGETWTHVPADNLVIHEYVGLHPHAV